MNSDGKKQEMVLTENPRSNHLETQWCLKYDLQYKLCLIEPSSQKS